MSAVTQTAGYLFDNAWGAERERLQAVERVWDEGTIRQLERLGAGPGRRCLEVGAGAGSIASWLAERGCSVVATDVDPRFLEDLPGVEARRHDVVADELPEREFDLVHARMVLQHLPARETALGRLVRALRPGGRLLLEDTDWSTLLVSSPPRRELLRLKRALRRVMTGAGFDPQAGLRHAGAMRAAGLVDVGAEGRVGVAAGPGGLEVWYRLWVERLRAPLLGSGLLTERELERALAVLADPNVSWLSQAMISTWGRRSETRGGEDT